MLITTTELAEATFTVAKPVKLEPITVRDAPLALVASITALFAAVAFTLLSVTFAAWLMILNARSPAITVKLEITTVPVVSILIALDAVDVSV